MDQVTNVLQNYNQGSGAPDEREVATHFNQVAQAAPREDLAGGLASMFRSDQTPAFPQLVSQLFGNSDPNQKASLLNSLLSSGAGAGMLAQLAKSAGIAMPAGGGAPQITPEQAAQIPPQAVQQAAAHAEKSDPSIVDMVSNFYAAHPTLVKTLGTMAMTMAMSHLAG
ncbi:MAG: hypothetical protein ACJ8KX_05235, partial [Chthoniobacterales bacterium]